MTTKQLQVGILGLGAIGSVLASYLQENPAIQLRCFNRSVKKDIQIIRPSGQLISFAVNCHQSLADKIDLDCLLICLKEHHFAEAEHWFKTLISPTTKILVIRNGLLLKEPLLPFAPENHILECMIDCPVQQQKNGVYQQFKNPVLNCAANPYLEVFQSLFSNEEISIHSSRDFKTENWKKLCESSAIGAITCLSGETCRIFKDPAYQDLFRQIATECIAVARADGAKITNDFLDQLSHKLLQYPADKGSSMLTDRLQGKPIELGAKNGIISSLATHYGIPSPINDWICRLLKHLIKFDFLLTSGGATIFSGL